MTTTTYRARVVRGVTAVALLAGALIAGPVGAPAAAATTCPGMQLTLSNADGADTWIGVDDDLELRLNGTTIFSNNDEIATNLDPIHFTAAHGDQLRVIASNSTIYGGHEYIASLVLYCDANASTQVLEATATEYASGGYGEVFFDRTYTIEFAEAAAYDFVGFLQPIDNLPVLNSVRAGSAVPVKFSLSGDQGLAIFASGYPRSQANDCGSTAGVDPVEETVSAGSSSLSYDATSDTYTYVWKTDKVWAGTCRQLVLALDDGTFHRANFAFK
jgi:hypothetical protein